jgi:hypothetical protein
VKKKTLVTMDELYHCCNALVAKGDMTTIAWV